jgi:4-amino-4-deoxy-L-arabinose transferase-like glycosyltransferase
MHASPRQRWILAALILVTVCALVPGNSESRRLRYHEILVAQTATEMIERNDLLVPHVMGEVRLKKPPLSYWLALAAHRLLGDSGSAHVSEFEARLPSIVSGVLLVLVTYALGLLLARDPRGGLVAAAVIATSLAFYVYSRNARPEMLYTCLTALMTLGFVLALRRAEDGRSTTGAAIMGWCAFSLALMAKGPQLPLFITLGLILTFVIQGRRDLLSKVLRPWLALPFIALPIAYFGFLGLQFDNAFSLWGAEMVQSYDVPVWLRPLRFYFPTILVVSVLPWIIVFGFTIRDTWKRRDAAASLLATGVLVSLVLLSFSDKLRPHYVLPLLPLCAALMARAILGVLDSTPKAALLSGLSRSLIWSQFGLVGLSMLGVVSVFFAFEEGTTASKLLSWEAFCFAVAGLLFLAAGLFINRSLASSFAGLVGALLLVLIAASWMEIDRSDDSQTAYQFVEDVEAYLPDDHILYLNSTRLLLYHYYSSNPPETLSLKRWKESGNPEQVPYFIVRIDQLEKSHIDGEILLEQHGHRDDKGMVLFRPDASVR